MARHASRLPRWHYLLWPRTYPIPRIIDGAATVDTQTLERGSVVTTYDDDTAHLNLGNYVNVTMQPLTMLRISGNRYQEKILLEHGHVDVAVTKKTGTFDVAVGPALVSVTGTHFGVDVLDNEPTDNGLPRFRVNVTEGSVVVRDGSTGQPVTLKDKRQPGISRSQHIKIADIPQARTPHRSAQPQRQPD